MCTICIHDAQLTLNSREREREREREFMWEVLASMLLYTCEKWPREGPSYLCHAKNVYQISLNTLLPDNCLILSPSSLLSLSLPFLLYHTKIFTYANRMQVLSSLAVLP